MVTGSTFSIGFHERSRCLNVIDIPAALAAVLWEGGADLLGRVSQKRTVLKKTITQHLIYIEIYFTSLHTRQ